MSKTLLAKLRRSRSISIVTLGSMSATMAAPLFVARRAAADAYDSPFSASALLQSAANVATDGIAVPQSSSASWTGQLASVDPTTGAAGASYPFALAPARGSVQPTLSLNYSSLNGEGDAGVGWRLSLPSIERRSPAGLNVPTFHDQGNAPQQDWDVYDTFVYDGRPLAPICFIRAGICPSSGEVMPTFTRPGGWFYYRLLVDDGGALRFFYSPDHRTWVVQSKTETMELGAPLDHRHGDAVDVDATSGGVFRWRLSRRYDYAGSKIGQHTNPIVYLWRGATLVDIYDTPGADGGYATLTLGSFANHTHLWWRAHPYNHATPPVWRATTNALLTRVDVTSKNASGSGARELVRLYALRYSDQDPRTAAQTSHHAQLLGITQEGRCPGAVGEGDTFQLPAADPGCLALPETTFGYSPAVPPVTANPVLAQPVANAIDIAQAASWVLDHSGNYASYPGTYDPIDARKIANYAVFDVNGDSLPDALIVPGSKNAADTTQRVLLNTGGGFSLSTVNVPPSLAAAMSTATASNLAPPIGLAGDWYGDRRLDVLLGRQPYAPSASAGPSTMDYGVYAIGGNPLTWSTSKGGTWDFRMDPQTILMPSCGLVDLDGDGLQDCLAAEWAWNGSRDGGSSTFLGLGAAFSTKDRSGGITPPWGPGGLVAPTAAGLPLRAFSAGSVVTPFQQAQNAYDSRVQNRGDRNGDGSGLLGSGWLNTFSRPYYHADMDGDGIVDAVFPHANDIPGRGTDGTGTAADQLEYWRGHGDGWFGEGVCVGNTQGQTTCGYGPDARATVSIQAPFPMDPDSNELHFADVNGDGLADLLIEEDDGLHIRLNVDGLKWSDDEIALRRGIEIPEWNKQDWHEHTYDHTQVWFADMNGNGVDDIVLIGHHFVYLDLLEGGTPNLLTSISNGLGGREDITYTSSAQLPYNALDAASSHAPQAMQVVTQLHVGNGLLGANNVNKVIRFDYSDPVYDGRARQFRGFRHVTTTNVGDGAGTAAPGSITRTTYAIGDCPTDGAMPCAEGVDDVYQAIRGLPVLTETLDEGGTIYHSTVHRTYEVRRLFTAEDDRVVRLVYPSQTDTFLYDASGPFNAPGSSPLAPGIADISAGDATDAAKLQATAGGGVPVRAQSGVAHLRSSVHADDHGNTDFTIQYGRVDDGGTFNATVDTPISTSSTYFAAPVTPGGWSWRVQTQTTYSGASPQAPPPSAQTRVTEFVYDVDANLTDVLGLLVGSVPLGRSNAAGSPFAADPATQSHDGTVSLYHAVADEYGSTTHAQAAGGNCVDSSYDSSFQEWPVHTTVYAGPSSPGGCGSVPLDTFTTFDPGLGVVLATSGASNDVAAYEYDGLGRITAIYEPDPDQPGVPSSAAFTTVFYYPSPAEGIMRLNTRSIVPAGGYRSSWKISDGLGQTLATLDQAEGTPDTGGWVLSAQTIVSLAGVVERAFVPVFWNGDPATFGVTTPTQASESLTHDAFGRVTKQVGLDGQSVRQAVRYHALSSDVSSSTHTMTVASDGLGRTAATANQARLPDGTLDVTTTTSSYRATGELVSVVRAHSAGPETFARSMVYDSLGRMVENFEPNTQGSSSGPSWIYAYDDAGRVVGTRDSRGCGKNVFYDGAGRTLAEDYSPCAAGQEPYSAPDLATGDGTEAFYVYDAPPPGQTLTPAEAAAATGRLTALSDRGSQTLFTYDGRGRPVRVQRRVAKPGDASLALASRYSADWHASTTSYDAADRVSQQSTGAAAPGLLVDGQSVVTTSYGVRGLVSSVSSSYGPLVASASFDADGAPRKVAYGDAGQTAQQFTYDALGRLQESILQRGTTPAFWSDASSGYRGPGPNDPPTQIKLYQDLFYHYDAVDNPRAIDDRRADGEWPPGAKPVNRTATYDDHDRLWTATYATQGGALDSWTSPSAASSSAVSPMPASMASKRVGSQTYEYDWLGDMTSSSDDQALFFDRSTGQALLGASGGASGPNQVASASSARGQLQAHYDSAGNLADLEVNRLAGCEDTVNGCGLVLRYEWDEVGRLAHAERWDMGAEANAGVPSGGASYPAGPPLSAPGTEPCPTLAPPAYSGALAMLASAKTSASANAAANPGGDAQAAADSIDQATARVAQLESWQTSVGYTGTNATTAYNTHIYMFEALDFALAAASAASKSAASTGNADAIAAFEWSMRAAYALNELSTEGGRCYMDDELAPQGSAPAAPPAMTACAALDSTAFDPLAALLTSALTSAQADLTANGGQPATEYAQFNVNAVNYAIQALGTLRTSLASRPLTAVDPATAASMQAALSQVAHELVYASHWADISAVYFRDVQASNSFESETSATQLALQLGAAAGACFASSYTPGSGSGSTGSQSFFGYPAFPTRAADAEVRYTYDATGTRVLRASTHPSAGGATYTAEIFPTLRLDGARWDGTAGYTDDETTEGVYLVASGVSYARVVFDPSLPARDTRSLGPGSGQHVFFEMADPLGSSSVVVDMATGELVERRTDMAYGAVDSDYRPARWKGFREAYGFTGKEQDVEVGLTYFGQRYYSAPLARWISPDPLAVHALGADLNPYAYVEGSVLAEVDPTGLDVGDTPNGGVGTSSEQVIVGDPGNTDPPDPDYPQDPPPDPTPTPTAAPVFEPAVSDPVALAAAKGMGHIESGDVKEFGKGMFDGLSALLGGPQLGTDSRYAGAHEVGRQLSQNLAFEGVGAAAGRIGGALPKTGKVGRFFYDARKFRTISRQYWKANGPARGASLHHWLIPQRMSWVPQGLRNAGWNLMELPAGPTSLTRGFGLNQWMGFAPRWGGLHGAAAVGVENGIRLAVPGAIAGSAYGGYRAGSWLADER